MKHDSKKQHWLVVNKSYWFQDIIIKANSILLLANEYVKDLVFRSQTYCRFNVWKAGFS